MSSITLLADFPTELLYGVISLLDPSDLARVCRLTHRLQSIAEPILYKDVSLNIVPTSVSGIELFLYSILSCPSLATVVRTLTLHWQEELILEVPDPRPPSLHDAAPLIASAASRVDLELDTPDDYIKLLLHVLPRLERLDLLPGNKLDIFDRNRCHGFPARLAHLQHVTCYSMTTNRAFLHGEYLSLLRAPSIHSLDIRLEHVVNVQPLDHAISTVGAKPRVFGLALSLGYFTTEMVDELLKARRELSRFSYANLPLIRGLDGAGIATILRTDVADSLRCLVLSWGTGTDSEIRRLEETLGPRFTVGSLRDRPVLVDIRCTLTVLLGTGPKKTTARLAALLPEVIFHFAIILDSFWSVAEIANQVVTMLEHKQEGELERLAAITVPSQVNGRVEELLRRACKRAGVRLVVRDKCAVGEKGNCCIAGGCR